jgi:hypothetical protein
MKSILLIVFLPFRVLAGNRVSGFLFNTFKRFNWLTIVLALIIAFVVVLL